MTAPPDTPPQVFAGVEAAIRSLRASGLRLSTARRLVLEALFAADGPVSASHLARTLALEESSVYRNLELLEHRGVVRHLHLGHSPGLYVLSSEPELEYLYCERCAKLTAVPPERLDPVREQVTREFGLAPRFTHFAIVGTCQECAGIPPAAAADRARTTPAEHHAPAGLGGRAARTGGHEHLHSYGDYVHSHAHAHPGTTPHGH